MTPQQALRTWPEVTSREARIKELEHLLRMAAVEIPDGPLHDRIVGFLSRRHEGGEG